MKRLSWDDDHWPDWAHTSAVILLAGCFAGPWLWLGVVTCSRGTLAAEMGPDFGTWLFGDKTLTGSAAHFAGACLMTIGVAWLVGGLACVRWAEGKNGVRWLLAGVSTLALLLYLRAMALA